jgi:hypothetical protein
MDRQEDERFVYEKEFIMIRSNITLRRIAAIGAICSLVAWIGTSIAQEETSVLVTKPAVAVSEGPALPPPANPNQQSASPELSVEPLPPVPPQPPTRPPQANRVKRPFLRPAEPKTSGPRAAKESREVAGRLTSAEEPIPPPEGNRQTDMAALDIRPTPPIEYDTDGDARDMYRATGEIELVMVTQNPADGCYYEIPMCIPGCCEGEPRVSSGRGIFGRGVVEYCWECGFRAEVRFRHILGDVKVDYEGD